MVLGDSRNLHMCDTLQVKLPTVRWKAGPHALEEANDSLHPAKTRRGAGSDRDWAPL